MANPREDADQYDEKEARERFEKALRGGLRTPPKPLKSMTPKRAGAKKKAKPSAPKSA